MDSPKRYDEKEAAEILRRAAELERSRHRPAVGGLSRADLEQVAADSGLDPAAVRAAIAEHERAGEARLPGGLLGGPVQTRFDRELEGALDDEGVEQVLAAAQQALGMHGPARRSGRLWSWSPEGVTRQLRVSVELRDGRTRLRVEERFGGLAGGLWGGLFGGSVGVASGIASLAGLGALHSLPAAAGLFAVLFGGAYLLTRGIYGSAVRRRHAELRELADRLAAEAGHELARLSVPERGGGRTEREGPERPLHRDPRRDEDEPSRRRGRERE